MGVVRDGRYRGYLPSILMVYPDLCLGFLTGNQSFYAGLGDFTLGEDSFALAKSSGSAFYEPIIPGDKLKGDLQEALLSKKMTISDWSRMCVRSSQVDGATSFM